MPIWFRADNSAKRWSRSLRSSVFSMATDAWSAMICNMNTSAGVKVSGVWLCTNRIPVTPSLTDSGRANIDLSWGR